MSHSSVIGAGAAAVWALVADPTQRPGWMTELVAVDAAPGLVTAGDRFDGRSRILFHDFLGASEVTDVQPCCHLEEQVVIGARFVSRWTLAPQTDGTTEVHHTIDVDFPEGLFSAVERWVLRRRLLRMQRQSLRNLDRVLVNPG